MTREWEGKGRAHAGKRAQTPAEGAGGGGGGGGRGEAGGCVGGGTGCGHVPAKHVSRNCLSREMRGRGNPVSLRSVGLSTDSVSASGSFLSLLRPPRWPCG